MSIINNFSPDDPIIRATLKIVNNKPYDIQNALVKLTRIIQDKFIRTNIDLPRNLWWGLEGEKSISWGGIKIHKNRESPKYICIATYPIAKQNVFLMTGRINENNEEVDETFISLDTNSTYRIY